MFSHLFLPPSHFSFQQDFLNSLNRTLHIPSIKNALPKIQRTNDTFLIDNLTTHTMTTIKKKRFNNVRLWMKVYSLLEICTADGHNIAHDSWAGNHMQFTNQLWPMQAKPGPKKLQMLETNTFTNVSSTR